MTTAQINHFQEWNSLLKLRVTFKELRNCTVKSLLMTKYAHSVFTRNDLGMRNALKPSRERLQEINEKLGITFGVIEIALNSQGVAGIPVKARIDPLIEWKTNPNYATGSVQSNSPLVIETLQSEKVLSLPIPKDGTYERTIDID